MKVSIRLMMALGMSLVVQQAFSQTPGCTDFFANNYNPAATVNDGSCLYPPESVLPSASNLLSDSLVETSGLILWDNRLWTHNDDNDLTLYGLDTLNGRVKRKIVLAGTVNTDWEELAQDSAYLYVGDFGNNAAGNRTDLHVLRIEKSTFSGTAPAIDTIFFSYADQTDFTVQNANETNFDCESMVVTADSIYLFTKQWLSQQTTVYALPKTPGTFIALKKQTLDVQGLVTGATYLPSRRLAVLCGYSSLLQPFFYLLYDFRGSDFFGGNKRKINISLPFHQVEGIASPNGLKYFVTNENFSQPPFISSPQKLHSFDLTYLLTNYFNTVLLDIDESVAQHGYVIYPIPTRDLLYIDLPSGVGTVNYSVFNMLGQKVLSGTWHDAAPPIDLSGWSIGTYSLHLFDPATGLVQRSKIVKN